MRTATTIALVLLTSIPELAAAAQTRLGGVEVETSSEDVRAPGVLGVVVRLLDDQGQVIPLSRVPRDWAVRITVNRAPVFVELWPRSSTSTLEADVSLRRSGVHRIGAQVESVETGAVLAESEQVRVQAATAIDYGVVRAGETVCHELPDGGRGLLGEVVDGTLPHGLRLWGGCLVADDTVNPGDGTVRASVAVLSGSGQGRRVERRLYDITYRLEPRLLTPRRVFYGVSVMALLAMVAFVGVSVRSVQQRSGRFGQGTSLAWTTLEGSPYRGERPQEWSLIDLSSFKRRRGALDVGGLLTTANIGAGVLKVRPTGDGLVEFIGPRREEIKAVTPDRAQKVGRHRLRVPYGSAVSFRGVAFAPLLGDDGAALDELRGIRL